MQTNEEREQFIEAFWQRRDPTPDTVENEFKEEHYRRIAYANERFASGIPGWRTDRGRIYIMWGPPDEIESHSDRRACMTARRTKAAARPQAYPFDDWRYRYMEGIGSNIIIEFVDPDRHRRISHDHGSGRKGCPGASTRSRRPACSKQMGMSNQAERFTRTDGSTAPDAMLGNEAAWTG